MLTQPASAIRATELDGPARAALEQLASEQRKQCQRLGRGRRPAAGRGGCLCLARVLVAIQVWRRANCFRSRLGRTMQHRNLQASTGCAVSGHSRAKPAAGPGRRGALEARRSAPGQGRSKMARGGRGAPPWEQMRCQAARAPHFQRAATGEGTPARWSRAKRSKMAACLRGAGATPAGTAVRPASLLRPTEAQPCVCMSGQPALSQ